VGEKWIVDVYVPKSFELKQVLDIEDVLKYISNKEINSSSGYEYYIYNFSFNTFGEALMFSKSVTLILKYKGVGGVFIVLYFRGV
jgi:hypothetical protein